MIDTIMFQKTNHEIENIIQFERIFEVVYLFFETNKIKLELCATINKQTFLIFGNWSTLWNNTRN